MKNHLDALSYCGPAGLSCDDTKAFKALWLYWDGTKKSYFLVGVTDGPIMVPNPESATDFMHNPNITKGTKVQLWTLQIPLLNLPPVIVAAIPITDKLAVDELLELHKTIVFGLLDNGINLVSYSCDGTETERSVQKRFSEVADSFISVDIPGP
ncbi:hypothetical protein C8J55DRAFT_487166 [Lentinula edodes]|uniref:Uncharacterized protein n=1 Tax=Lentinula lateritia TaxID=40482 RepID=A0A9W9ARJ8_9AGAR|nr:hypothetical protein C8J55DRAFT_487166 [Lentinula edodes]